MSTQPNQVRDVEQRNAAFAEFPVPRATSRRKVPRWLIVATPIAILGLAAAFEGLIWVRYEEDATRQVMLAWNGLPWFALALLAWWTLLTGFRWRTRVAGLGLIAVAATAFAATCRVKEFTGAMVPHFELRWQCSAEERAADYWRGQPGETVDASAKQGTLVEKLAIDPHDWPQFNGPSRNGRADWEQIRPGWETSRPRRLSDFEPRPPRQLWRHPVGPAWSSFAVVGDLAFTQEQRGPDEAVVCYDARTGAQIWAHLDRDQRFEELRTGVGPRATPTVYDSRVYTFGATGILNCLAARTGALLWTTNAVETAGVKPLAFGMTGSPLVYDNLVVVNPGGPRHAIDGTETNGHALAAYDRLTGRPVWAAGDSQAAYASPILATLGGVKQVVIFDALGAAGHDAANGKQLWRTPLWTNEFRLNVAEPIVGKDAGADGALFLSSGFGTGSILFDVAKSGDAWSVTKRLSAPNKFKLKFNSGVARDGVVYGLDEGLLACFDLSTGRELWKSGRYGYGQLLLFENLLLVISEEGDAVFLDVSPSKAQEVVRFPALDGETWNHPAYSHGRLYLRNAQEAACYDLVPAQAEW
jgi:outer membrane protein assembly factor BamB